MHKEEASKLFGILGDGDRVKICKMLYMNKELSHDRLEQMIGCDTNLLDQHLKLLTDNQLIVSVSPANYGINQPLVDELMAFIKTPCGCGNK